MIGSIRQRTIVHEGGRVEIQSSELPIGARVEVIVLVEPEGLDTTEYLLSSEANRQHLLQALKDAEDPANYTVVAADDL
jgi:antitoxin YefM